MYELSEHQGTFRLWGRQCRIVLHAIALGISDRSVRRTLHLDLKFHPYKMMVAQELSHRDWESRRICAENMNAVQENFPGHVISQRVGLLVLPIFLLATISFGAILTGKFMPTSHVILKNWKLLFDGRSQPYRKTCSNVLCSISTKDFGNVCRQVGGI